MIIELIKKLFVAGRSAQKKLAKMNPQQKTKLEESWDIEHAYYSSTLEGSKLDRKEFEELAKQNK